MIDRAILRPSVCSERIETHKSMDNDRTMCDPHVLAGKPVIHGTRLSVAFILGLMAERWTEADIMAEYAGLGPEDVTACLAYARDALETERPVPTAA